jgi:patatin-like phospholipase/acyl hydrolase
MTVSYRILSIDGGGIRGELVCVLLERLEQAHPGFLSKIDLFAGTSTGGILSAALAAGYSPSVARQLYELKGKLVFADSLLDDLRDLGNAVGAQYSNGGLIDALVEQFGDMKLGDLPKKVLISAFDLDNDPSDPQQRRTWKPKFFHNYPGPDSDSDESVVDVVVRTAAAPTYFPIYQGYIDGGVAAGNPSMCALAQALDADTGGKKLSEIALLSIGTGRFSHFLTSQSGDWGWTQWALPIVDIMLEGSLDVAHYQCSRVLGRRYCRIDPDLPEKIDMDAVDKIPQLKAIGEQVDLSAAIQWLNWYFPIA